MVKLPKWICYKRVTHIGGLSNTREAACKIQTTWFGIFDSIDVFEGFPGHWQNCYNPYRIANPHERHLLNAAFVGWRYREMGGGNWRYVEIERKDHE